MKTKKLIAILTIVALMMTLVPMAAFGAVMGPVTVALDSTVAGATATWTVTPTLTTALVAGNTLVLTFPADANIAGAASVAPHANLSAGVVTGQTITYTATGDVPAGALVCTVTNVVNPSKVGLKTVFAASTQDTISGGTTTITNAPPDMDASSATINATSVVANGTAAITMTIYVFDGYNNPVSGATVFVDSSRNADLVSTPAVTDAFGKTTATFKSYIAGTAKIGAAITDATALTKYLQGASGVSKTDAGLIDAFDVTFTPAAASNLTIVGDGGTDVANGIDTNTVTATLKDAGGNPVANATVNFSVDKAGAALSAATGTTNAVGQVTTKVSSTVAGTVNVTATAGTVSKTVAITFNASGAYDIVLVEGAGQKVATGTAPIVAPKFNVTDINGNKYTNPVAALPVGTLTVATVSKPTGSTITTPTLIDATDGSGYAQMNIPAFDKAGTYVFRVALTNGKAATVEVTVADQGPITQAGVMYFQKSLSHGQRSSIPFTYLMDDAFTATYEDQANFNWSSSDVTLATVKNGPHDYANSHFAGMVTASELLSKKGTVTITGVHKTRGFVVTATIEVGNTLASMKATAPAKTEVGSAASVPVQLIDDAGNNKPFNASNKATINLSATVVKKPADAIVEVSVPNAATYQKTLTEGGNSTITVKSTKAGKVTLAITATETVGGQNFTALVDVEFVAPKVVVGANNVVMFIGAKAYTEDGVAKLTDVAPFIKDSRTFVAVRPVAEAFAAEIDWNEATKTVTLTRADVTVTIVIGSNTINVVRDGVTETVTADVPAYIVDGRTVLPFRAVGEAFGATVNYDAATQSVSFVQE